MWFKTELTSLPLNLIKEDKFFRFTDDNPEELRILKLSIAQIGVINPVIVQPLQKNMYRIVSGFKRFFAAKELGLSSLPARILKDNLPSTEILSLTLLAHPKKLSLAEKARVVRIMNFLGLSSEQIIQKYGSFLDINSRELVEAYLKISNYHPALLSYLSAQGISLKQSLAAEGLSFQEQNFLLSLVNSLNVKGYDFRNILIDLKEIATREKKRTITIVKELGIPEILEDSTLTRSQKTDKVKTVIRERRYPLLTKINRELKKLSKKLKFSLPAEVKWDSKLEEPGLKLSFRIIRSETVKSIVDDLSNKSNVNLIRELLRTYYEGLSDKESMD